MGVKTIDVVFWPVVLLGGILAGVSSRLFGYWALLPIFVAVVAVVVAVAWRRRDRTVAVSVTPNWVLMAAPTMLAAPAINLRVGALAIAVLGAGSFISARRGSVSLTWPCAALPVISLMIVLRPNGETPARTLLFIVACAIIARAVYVSASRTSALVSLVDGLGLFCIASVLLWLVGVTGDPGRTAGIAGGNTLTGGERVIFPLSNGLSMTPNMAAAYLVAAGPILIVYGKYQLLRLTAVACAASICVLSNVRSAMIVGLLLGICVLLAPWVFRRVAPWLVGISLIVPFVFGHFQDAANWVLGALRSSAPWLTRRDLFSAREFVWSESLTHYLRRVDWVHQLFGYGFRGQAESGASSYYTSNISFGEYGIEARFKSPHNSMLQLLFDGGLITATVAGVTVLCMAVVLARKRSDLAGLAMLTALVVVAASESSLSPGHMLPPWWALVALAMVTFARDRAPSGGESATDVSLPEQFRSRSSHLVEG